jgi:hypothetical protein
LLLLLLLVITAVAAICQVGGFPESCDAARKTNRAQLWLQGVFLFNSFLMGLRCVVCFVHF